MIIKVLKAGKWNSFLCNNGDNNIFLTPTKNLAIGIEVGKTYEVETWNKEGSKTTYISKAKLIDGEAQVETPKTESKPDVKKEVKTDTDKMSKSDWAKKDAGIKWIALLKASANFHARRVASTIDNVIDDARKLFSADAVMVEPRNEKEKDIYKENGL